MYEATITTDKRSLNERLADQLTRPGGLACGLIEIPNDEGNSFIIDTLPLPEERIAMWVVGIPDRDTCRLGFFEGDFPRDQGATLERFYECARTTRKEGELILIRDLPARCKQLAPNGKLFVAVAPNVFYEVH